MLYNLSTSWYRKTLTNKNNIENMGKTVQDEYDTYYVCKDCKGNMHGDLHVTKCSVCGKGLRGKGCPTSSVMCRMCRNPCKECKSSVRLVWNTRNYTFFECDGGHVWQ